VTAFVALVAVPPLGVRRLPIREPMKSKLKVVRTVSAVALLTLAGCSTPSGDASRGWEYRVVQGWSGPGGFQAEEERAEFERQLNEAGAQGYSVVSSTHVPGDANNKAKTIVILKRPRR
jgi:hypothetical protein